MNEKSSEKPALCKEQIFHGYRLYPCGRKAKTDDGYCGIHDPAKRKAREDAWRRKFNEAEESRRRAHDIRQAEQEVVEAAMNLAGRFGHEFAALQCAVDKLLSLRTVR